MTLALVLAAVLPHTAALAQAQPGAQRPLPRDTLPAVMVTATRVAMATAAPIATTTVLRGDALRAAGITRVLDALRLVSGAAVVASGAVGSQTSLFLRGGNSNYVRVLVDGVPLNDAGGAFDFATLTTDNVDRIEIVRGPASVLYGSDAVTGVVQIFTKQGSGPLAARVLAGRGSYGASRTELGTSGGNTHAGFTLGGSRSATDGILAFNNQFANDVLSASARFGSDAGTDVQLAGRWSSSSYHYPTDYTGAVVDHTSEQTEHRLVLSVDGGQRLGSAAEVRVLLASSEFLPRTNDPPDGPADTIGSYGFFSRGVRTHRSADTRLNVHYAPRGILTTGVDLATDRERSSSLSLSQFGNSAGGFEAERHNTGWYAQVVGDASDRVSYSLGARLDRNSAFGSFPTVRANLGWAPMHTTRLRASAGSAFKAPSFFENFATGFVTGNPLLRPERSRSAELGIEQILAEGTLSLKATGYVQRFRDVIQYTGTPPSRGAPNYFNVAAADANGLELEAEYRPLEDFTLAAAYTWTGTRTTDAGFDKGSGALYVVGQRLIRRPPHTALLSIARSYAGGGHVQVVATRIGERDDRDFTTFPARALVLPAYTRVDFSFDLPVVGSIARGLAVTGRADNLFGAKYEEI
ncbi:MAG TPA: TonB-dependent receptor, partial [Gemmatimonadaceae bacterium]|nr:TonB-dependent receptor [Gemmatimonadaceae bacterium]